MFLSFPSLLARRRKLFRIQIVVVCSCDLHLRRAPPFRLPFSLSRLIAYLVPYLPVTPTFLVLFVIFAVVAVMNGVIDLGR